MQRRNSWADAFVFVFGLLCLMYAAGSFIAILAIASDESVISLSRTEGIVWLLTVVASGVIATTVLAHKMP